MGRLDDLLTEETTGSLDALLKQDEPVMPVETEERKEASSDSMISLVGAATAAIHAAENQDEAFSFASKVEELVGTPGAITGVVHQEEKKRGEARGILTEELLDASIRGDMTPESFANWYSQLVGTSMDERKEQLITQFEEKQGQNWGILGASAQAIRDGYSLQAENQFTAERASLVSTARVVAERAFPLLGSDPDPKRMQEVLDDQWREVSGTAIATNHLATLVFDVALPGVRAFRLASRATTAGEAAKIAASVIPAELGASVAATGSMAIADLHDASFTITLLAGILGGVGCYAFITAGQRGLRQLTATLKANHPDIHKQLMAKLGSRKDRLALAIKEASDNPTDITEKIQFSADSPLSEFALQAAKTSDTGLIDMSVNTIRQVRRGLEPGVLQNTINDVVGTGINTPYVGVLKKSGGILYPSTDFAEEFFRASRLENSIGTQLFAKEMMEGFESVLVRRVGDSVNINSPLLRNWSLVKPGELVQGPLKRWFGSSLAKFNEAGQDAFVTGAKFYNNVGMRITEHYNKMYKRIVSGLSREQEGNLHSVLTRINDARSFSITPHGIQVDNSFVPMSKKEMAALYQYKGLMDTVWADINAVTARSFKNRGLKWHEDLGPVQVIKRAKGQKTETGELFTKEMREDGNVLLQYVNRNGNAKRRIVSAEEADSLREIRETDALIDRHDFYVRRAYTEDFVIFRNTKGGDTVPIATAPSFKKAEQARKTALEKLAKERGVSVSEIDDTRFIAVRRGEQGSELALDTKDFSDLTRYSPRELEELKRSLGRAGVKTEELEEVIDTITALTYRRESFLRARKAERLLDYTLEDYAPIVPTDEAISSYLHKAGNYVGAGEYRDFIISRFAEKYRKYLERGNLLGKVRPGTSPVVAAEIKSLQAQLIEILNMRSTQEIALESAQRRFGEELYHWAEHGRNPVSRFLSRKLGTVMLNAPSLYWVGAKLKAFTGQAYLGLWSASAGLLQLTSVLTTTGRYAVHHPSILSGGMKDAMQALVAMGGVGTKKAKALLSEMRKANFLGDLDDAILDVSMKQTFGYRELKQAHMSLYKSGEGLQRMAAWFTSRRYVIRGIKKGKYEGLTMKDVKNSSIEFLHLVHKEATQTSLDMSRFNRQVWGKGIWGVPTQFLSFVAHQTEAMFSRRLSLGERISMWMQWSTTFGIGGVPLLADSLAFLDEMDEDPKALPSAERYALQIANWAMDTFDSVDIKQRNTIKNALRYGMAGVLTNEQIATYTRASLSGYVSRIFDNASIPQTLAPSIGLINNIIDGSVDSLKTYMRERSLGRDFSDSAWSGFKTGLGQEFPGVRRLIAFGQAYETGEYRGRDENLLVGDITPLEMYGIALGFEPHRVAEARDFNSWKYETREKWRKWINDHAKKFAEAAQIDPASAKQEVSKAFAYLETVDLAGHLALNPNFNPYDEFAKAMAKYLLRYSVPLSERDNFDAIVQVIEEARATVEGDQGE